MSAWYNSFVYWLLPQQQTAQTAGNFYHGCFSSSSQSPISAVSRGLLPLFNISLASTTEFVCAAVPLSLSLLKWLFKINNCLNDLLWQEDKFSGKFGRGSRTGTELVDLLYHGAWGPLWCGNEFFNEKKIYHSVLQWKTCWNTVFHFAFAHVICPQMTSGISKFQALFHNITAHHKILGSVLRAWGLSYRFHNCAQELVLFGRKSAHGAVKRFVQGDRSHEREQKRGLGSRAPWSVPRCLLAPWGRQAVWF